MKQKKKQIDELFGLSEQSSETVTKKVMDFETVFQDWRITLLNSCKSNISVSGARLQTVNNTKSSVGSLPQSSWFEGLLHITHILGQSIHMEKLYKCSITLLKILNV